MVSTIRHLLCMTLLTIPGTSASADELLFPNSDFESGTLDGWTVDGEAFQVQPTKGDNTVVRNRESSNLQGTWWIGGDEKFNGKEGRPGATAGDALTGTLTSQEFIIRQRERSDRAAHRNG